VEVSVWDRGLPSWFLLWLRDLVTELGWVAVLSWMYRLGMAVIHDLERSLYISIIHSESMKFVIADRASAMLLIRTDLT